jgi:hypothetical protein
MDNSTEIKEVSTSMSFNIDNNNMSASITPLENQKFELCGDNKTEITITLNEKNQILSITFKTPNICINDADNVVPNANANVDPNANANANVDPNANANANVDPNANANVDPIANANVVPNANANVVPNANAFPGGYRKMKRRTRKNKKRRSKRKY